MNDLEQDIRALDEAIVGHFNPVTFTETCMISTGVNIYIIHTQLADPVYTISEIVSDISADISSNVHIAVFLFYIAECQKT